MKKKLAALLGVVMAVVVGLAAPAFAHVVVEPSTAAKGAEQTFVFRVPNEIDSSSTVSLDVRFPTATPITGVAVEPVPGWTSHVTLPSLLGLLYIAIFGTAVYYLIYQYAIKKSSPVTATLTFYLSPIAGYLWAAVLLGEKLTSGLVFGAMLALIGVYFVTIPGKKAKA